MWDQVAEPIGPAWGKVAEGEIVTSPNGQIEEERQSAMTFYLVIAVIVLAALVLSIMAERYL
jgi:hypothetical protein